MHIAYSIDAAGELHRSFGRKRRDLRMTALLSGQARKNVDRATGQIVRLRSFMRILIGAEKIVEIDGPADITKETTDAIVNAANSSLLGGGGVDGAIHRAGGPVILAECRQIVSKIGRLPAGQAVITTGGKLSAKYVIHTVGPIYRGGEQGEPETLANCHRESIRLADENGLTSLSFPAISTGAFGYPIGEAAHVAISAVSDALRSTKSVKLCRFILFDSGDLRTFERAAKKLEKTNSFQIEKANS